MLVEIKSANMKKYVTSLKELVYLAIPNWADVKSEANRGNPEACFQFGLILLLGVNANVDYALAKKYLGKPCLADNPEAIRMIGFIDELEGNFSSAFHHYAKSKIIIEEDKYSNYIDQVLGGRYELQEFLKKLGLFPNSALNGIITEIINSYIQGGDAKTEAKIKIAYICNDKPTCYEAAKELYELGYCYAASQWIKKCNVSEDDILSVSISDSFSESAKLFEISDEVEIEEIDGTSLLINQRVYSLAEIKDQVNRNADERRTLWQHNVKQQIDIFAKEKRDKDYKDYLEESRLQEKKRNKRIVYTSGIIAGFIPAVIIFPISFKYRWGELTTMILWGLFMFIILLIAKSMYPEAFKENR